MVCLGNICRSPLAEGILRSKLEQKGLKHITVDSAGTSDYHIGENPDSRSVKNARSHGIDISALVCRQFTVVDFDRFDRIYVMDSSNYRNVVRLARNEGDLKKVKLILNELHPGSDLPVPDPYQQGEEGFENVFQLLDKASDAILKSLHP